MKIACTTSGDTLESPLDSRFGRAPKFIIYDTETKGFQVIDNVQNLEAAQGAGIQSAETVARAEVDCLVTGHCGPKAFKVLTAAGIRVFTGGAGTVSEAITAFQEGRLEASSEADVEGHWV